MGEPEQSSLSNGACTIYMTEKDFHKMLDRKLKVRHAVMQRRIKIDGGVNAI